MPKRALPLQDEFLKLFLHKDTITRIEALSTGRKFLTTPQRYVHASRCLQLKGLIVRTVTALAARQEVLSTITEAGRAALNEILLTELRAALNEILLTELRDAKKNAPAKTLTPCNQPVEVCYHSSKCYLHYKCHAVLALDKTTGVENEL